MSSVKRLCFLDVTETRCNCNCFRIVFPKKEPANLQQLYPSASVKAVRLIGQMLKMEPNSRISAEDALNNAYLSRYHDPDDEPICVPAFDFSFEKQVHLPQCCFIVTSRMS